MLATYRSLQLQAYDAVLSGYCSQWASLREDYLRLREEAKLMTRKRLISAFEAQSGFNLLIMSPVAAGVGLTVGRRARSAAA